MRSLKGGDAGAIAILGEIVHVQREYLRDGDPQRMWDELLDSLLRTTGSSHGFISEVEWSPHGIPSLTTRAMVWLGRDETTAAPHPDIGLLLAQVIARQAPVVLNPGPSGRRSRRPQKGDIERFEPISGFLGLPLLSSDRLVGIVGLTSPDAPYDSRWVDALAPLLATCASIVEALQSGRDRDAAVEELEQTAAFLQALFNGTTHAVLVIDGEGRVRSTNPAAETLFGRPAGSLAGRSFTELLAEPNRRGAQTAARRLVRNGVPPGMPSVTMQVLAADGQLVPVEASIGEMTSDGERRLVVLCQDIRERLEAQSALARAGEILDATPDLIAWTTAAGRIAYLNGGGREMLALGAGDPLGDLRIEDLCTPDARERFVTEALPQARSAGSWTGELRLSRIDGSTVPVSVAVLSEPEYTAVIARDLTERYEIERLKEGFVSNVSHELRTPLTAVIGYLELLREGSLGELTPTQADAVEVMHRNGDRLLQLIGEILIVGSFDAGHRGDTRPVDLSSVVTSVVADHRISAGGGSVALEAAVDPAVVVVGDEAELRSAVSNLIANAVKFTGPGGRVDVRLARSGDQAVLEVADTGMGIPPDELDRVFQRFFRGEHARDGQIQGTGLGLSIVDGVIRRHGGTIDVASRVGEGSAFRVTLAAGGGTP